MADDEAGRLTGAPGKATRRWWVHLGLIASATTSLVFEPVLTLHIVLGLGFVGLVALHLVQRRRVSARLAARLLRIRTILRPAGRMALADLLLAGLAVAMLVSGCWDWALGHPTKVRWHALTGVLLAVFLLVHTLRRRTRLRTSKVR